MCGLNKKGLVRLVNAIEMSYYWSNDIYHCYRHTFFYYVTYIYFFIFSSHSIRNVYLPPHFYGQLVQHAEGLKVLENENVLSELFHNIRYPCFSSEMNIIHLKAALWAVVR